MKDLSVAKLNDIYGAFLTEKQRDMLTQYYDLDYSLAEIAENAGVSRQSVHCSLRQGVDELIACERRLHLIGDMQALADRIGTAERYLSEGRNEAARNVLIELQEGLRREYGTVRQFK